MANYENVSPFISFFFSLVILIITQDNILSLFWFFISSFIINQFYLQKSVNEIYESGYIGEKKCLNLLKKLPRDFIIFNQLEIPSESSSYNVVETDFIIIGKSTLFIIECKRFQSQIICENVQHDWLKNEFYEDGKLKKSIIIKSPLSQINKQKKFLELFLVNFSITVNIEKILFLDMDKENYSIPTNCKIPIFNNKRIIKYIKDSDVKEYSINANERLLLIDVLSTLNQESIQSRKMRLKKREYIKSFLK
jgi:hypothetical protein